MNAYSALSALNGLMHEAKRFALMLLTLLTLSAPAHADPARWQILPPTPTLPTPVTRGLAPVGDIKMYFATFGAGRPVILLHGGLANADYWGNQVPVLAQHYQVIVADSRGHGRSTRSAQPYSYELMASDVVGLMDYLKLPKAAVVGWSDGAIIGLELAIHHPDRVTGVFAFAANYNPSGVREDLDRNATFNAFIDRCSHDYRRLSATPDQYPAFLAAITKMWATEPNLSPDLLRHIKVPVEIVDGDHDEAIKRSQTEEMADLIPGAGLLIQPNVSHFSMLQDPAQFTESVRRFLDTLP